MRILASVVILVLLPTVAWAQGTATAEPETVKQFSKFIRWSGVLTSTLVVFGAWLALRFMRETIDRIGRQFAGRRLLLQKIATLLQFCVYIVTSVLVVSLSIRLDDRVLAVIGGTLAVAVGFAIKDLVASFIAGIMIMVDRPFQVGDRVSFGGEYGDITSIGLRSVRLQTLDDNTVTIPNNKFLNDISSCGNYGALDMQVVMDFYVGLEQDIELAREVVTEAALTSRYVYLPKPVTVLVGQVIKENYIAVRLRLKAYVLDTRFEKAFETDVNLGVMRAFRQHSIKPPAILHRDRVG